MALMTVQRPTATGAAIVYSTPTVSDTFANTGREYLHIKTGGTGCTVTVAAPNPCSFGVTNVIHADVVVLGTSADAAIGPFPTDKFSNAAGLVTVTYSQVTTVTSALLS